MDPLSISAAALGIAASLFQVSKSVHTFTRASKTVDRTLCSLQSQADGLANVLKSLGVSLDRPALTRLADDNADLWLQIAGSVEACRRSVDEFSVALRPLTASRNNQFQQAWRQFKLNLAEDDINRILSALRTHSINLQLSVGIINVLLCTSSSDNIIQDQASRFERLERMIATIDERIHPVVKNARLDDSERDDCVLDENTAQLTKFAHSVMSSASTVRSGCTATYAQHSQMPNTRSVWDDFDLCSDQEQATIGSTTGSEFGVPLGNAQRGNIHHWIEGMPQIPEQGDPDALSCKSQSDQTVSNNAIGQPDAEITHDCIEFFENSSEDDIDFVVTQNLFSNANTAYSNKEFANAEPLIKTSIEHSKRLNQTQQEILGTKDMHLRYAICVSNVGKLDVAEELFLEIANDRIQNSADAKRVFEATHNLAILLLRKSNFEAAEIHCRQAMHGRRRTKTIGKLHDDYLTSIELYAVILWAQGDRIRTQAYLDLLPDEKKIEVSDMDEKLRTWQDRTLDQQNCPVTHFQDVETLEKTTESNETDRHECVWDNSASSTFKKDTRTLENKSVNLNAEQNPTSLSSSQIEVITGRTSAVNPQMVAVQGTMKLNSQTSSEETSVDHDLYCRQSGARKLAARSNLQRRGFHKPGNVNKGLIWAAGLGLLPEVEVLLNEYGANINARQKMKSREDIRNMRPASQRLDSGDKERKRAIDLAAQAGHLHVCEFLIKAGAKLLDETLNPLYIAAFTDKNYEVCRLLLDNHVTVDSVSLLGRTPLMQVASSGCVDLCSLLVSRGANVNHVDKSGNTSLMLASQGRLDSHHEICRKLLDAGAIVNASDLTGSTALMDAARAGRDNNCELLIRSSANVNSQNQLGLTALMYAACGGYQKTCKLLLDAGADVGAKNKEGDTAVQYAIDPYMIQRYIQSKGSL